MFKVDLTPEFKWPTTVKVPMDGGGHKKHTFTSIFKVSDEDYKDRADDEQITVEEIIKNVLVGWEGVADISGNEMEFTDENRDKVLKLSYVRNGILEAYTLAMSGQKAKRKN